jgi:hypothetical protein
VEVASPNATYELHVKTEIKNGVAIPKGRVSLPREAKPKSEDKILVFAEGRLAEEAKKAGAHIVGGPELIEGVRLAPQFSSVNPLTRFPDRSPIIVTRQLRFCALPPLYEQLHQN